MTNATILHYVFDYLLIAFFVSMLVGQFFRKMSEVGDLSISEEDLKKSGHI